ncbi:MAG TPA: HoxN/HupN/NixA family nickel/cobalt transporter [Candidatus Acidoferrales bacterium]|nr:HoxN/HupN/NixA family nickel/cobalt transporter [Candidatus Acidoferrales bacterium]
MRGTVGYAAAIAAFHLVGVALLISASSAHPAIVGIGFIAYTLGLRHAFDADHVAAIDGVVRKLVQERRPSLGVGFYFSLGHSSVVCIMALVAASVTGLATALPFMRSIGGLVGTLVSGGFLLLIGIVNLVVWFEIFVLFQKMRKGSADCENLDRLLGSRGLIARFAGPLFRLVTSSRQAYPIGFLFGLGFDTASEIALLAISVAAVASALPIAAVVALPLLFAAGMTMMDTLDGILMTRAYDWAFSTPLRKIYYNLTVTGLSVTTAFGIGVLQLGSLLTHSPGGVWSGLLQLDFTTIGVGLVALFALAWVLAYGAWRFLHLEERSTQTLGQSVE